MRHGVTLRPFARLTCMGELDLRLLLCLWNDAEWQRAAVAARMVTLEGEGET